LVVQRAERFDRLRERAEIHMERTNRLKGARKTLSIATRRFKESRNYFSTLIHGICCIHRRLAVLVVEFLVCYRLSGWWTLRVRIPLGGVGGGADSLFGTLSGRRLRATREDSIRTPSGLRRHKALS